MNVLFWNARGLGSTQAFHELRRLLAANSHSVVFICETKLNKCRCKNWQAILGFDGMLVVDSIGRSGGLLLLWKKPLIVSLRSYSFGHIDCVVEWEHKIFRFTGFYGNSESHLRRFSWELLRRLERENLSIPWMVGGDFNEIMFDSEKQGGIPRSVSLMNDFRDVVMDCGLFDCSVDDDPLTWFNNKEGNDAIWSRLDRVFVNNKWKEIFPNPIMKALDFFGSDHRSLLCRIISNETRGGGGRKRFFFEEKWLSDANLVPNFLEAWKGWRNINDLPVKLLECQIFFKKWSGTKFDKLGKQIDRLRRKRETILGRCMTKNADSQLLEIDKQMNKLLEMEEIHWKQRGRVNWLAQGDRNTPAFHAYALDRRRRNRIDGILDKEGIWVSKQSEVALVAENYFKKLFSSSMPSERDIDRVLELVPQTLDQDSWNIINMPFTEEEVRKALFSMHPSKAPGPDGLPGRFFQKFWPEIGDEITTAILDVLNNSGDLKQWNSSLIVLIPKVDKPRSMKEYRPISLCNTIYKVVSKVICNRLKLVLHDVIDENQSAFVAGRQITDIMVGFECIHWINTAGRNAGYAALKLDMSKAYDRVEWPFLEGMLKRMNFPSSFVKLVMHCICSVSYSCVVNGGVFGNFQPSRGLRQGDPLSPLLFVLCSQGFSSIINHLSVTKEMKPICFGNNGPRVSHLFFADDSLLFFKADEKGCWAIKRWMKYYEVASGQSINFAKSAICFSKAISQSTSRKVQSILGVEVVEKHLIYLGLPTVSCRNKRMQFGFLRDRALRKLGSWKNKLLSSGGKEVLIKAVIQSIPTFTMQCFKIPASICHEIERACARFWWGGDAETKRMHWRNWEDLCRPKSRGGLGFRSLMSFNKAMLAKQVWRIENNPQSFIARVMKAKYHPLTSIREASVKSSASFVWRSLCWSRPIIEGGTRWRVGDGKSIRLFSDSFIPDLNGGGIPNLNESEPNIKVSSFILVDKTWDRDKLTGVVGKFAAEFIVQVPIIQNGADRAVWNLGPKKVYSVKYGYLADRGYFDMPGSSSVLSSENWNKLIWQIAIPPKFCLFLWRLVNELVATPISLLRHHVPVNGLCELCKDLGTNLHCLFLCDVTKHIWKNTIFWPLLKKRKTDTMMEVSTRIYDSVSKGDYAIWAITSYFTWIFVCKKKHNSEDRISEVSVALAANFLVEFQVAQKSLLCRNSLGVKVGKKVWRPPPQGVFRIDVDAAVDWEKSLFGVGVVIRDWNGEVKAALAKPTERTSSVVEGEMQAILCGLELCYQARCVSVDIYSDSLLAVRLLINEQNMTDFAEVDMKPVREAIMSGVIRNISHVFRCANGVAHSLARFGARSENICIWLSDFPHWLRDLINE